MIGSLIFLGKKRHCVPEGAFVMHDRFAWDLGMLLRNQGVVQFVVVIVCMAAACNLLQFCLLLATLLSQLHVLTTYKYPLFVGLLYFPLRLTVAAFQALLQIEFFGCILV